MSRRRRRNSSDHTAAIFFAFLLLLLPPFVAPTDGPSFLLVQWATPKYVTEWAVFLGRNRQYAERHGYGYVLVDDESVRRALDGRPLHWGKVPALRSILATLSPIDDE